MRPATTVGTVTKTGTCGKAVKDATATFTVAGFTYDGGADCDARPGDRVKIRYDRADPAHNHDSYRAGAI